MEGRVDKANVLWWVVLLESSLVSLIFLISEFSVCEYSYLRYIGLAVYSIFILDVASNRVYTVLGVVLMCGLIVGVMHTGSHEGPSVTNDSTTTTTIVCKDTSAMWERECSGDECSLKVYSGVRFAQDDEGIWVNSSKVFRITQYEDDITFHYGGIKGYFNLTLEAGLIHNGNYYTMSQVKQAYPAVHFSFPIDTKLTVQKYALNISNVPSQVQSGVQNITLTYKGHEGFTLDQLKVGRGKYVAKGVMSLGFDDLRDAGFVVNIRKDQKRICIGNLSDKFINDSLYLDPTISINSTTSDGYVEYSGVPNGLWTTTRDASVGTVSASNGLSYNYAPGSYYGYCGAPPPNFCYHVYRAFLVFDTSPLPDNAIVTHANLYVRGKSNAYSTVSVQLGTQSDVLSNADFDSFSGNYYNYTNWISMGWNQLTFNSQGLSDISTTWTTKLCLREYTHDYLNSAPAGIKYNGMYFANDANYKPYLTINYTLPDNIEPSIYLEVPLNNTVNITNSTPGFRFNVSDNMVSTLDCNLIINDTCYGNNAVVANGTSTVIVANATLNNGDYWWKINCSDGTNTNVSDIRNISIKIEGISSCQKLIVENNIYTLTQNVSSQGTCFEVLANNVTLDCQGYTITYSQSTKGHAVNNSGGYDYFHIKNGNIIQGSTSTNSHAIYSFGVNEGEINNNTFMLVGGSSYGIFLYRSSNVTISNNTISTTASSSYGVSTDYSPDSTILDNIIHTGGGSSFGFDCNYYSNATFFSNNHITTTGQYAYGISLENQYVPGTIISNNTLIISGDYSYGIMVHISNATIRNNTISTEGTQGHGIIIQSWENSNSIIDCRMSISGTSAVGLYLSEQAHNHTIANSTIMSEQSSGIYVSLGNAENNTIYNCLINGSSTPVRIFHSFIGSHTWNTTQQGGVRVYGNGLEIGGNYHTNSTGTGYSDVCGDSNHNGFCDLPLNLTNNVECTEGIDCGLNVDYLPLSGAYSSGEVEGVIVYPWWAEEYEEWI